MDILDQFKFMRVEIERIKSDYLKFRAVIMKKKGGENKFLSVNIYNSFFKTIVNKFTRSEQGSFSLNGDDLRAQFMDRISGFRGEKLSKLWDLYEAKVTETS